MSGCAVWDIINIIFSAPVVLRLDVWWFTTCTLSVSDEADISQHHKSGGWARSAEVSHTGSSQINFLWPLSRLQGDKSSLNWAAEEERRPPLALHGSPRPLTLHMLLHLSPRSWCDHLWRSGNLPATCRATLNWTPPFCQSSTETSLHCCSDHLRWALRGNWFGAAPRARFNNICSNKNL